MIQPPAKLARDAWFLPVLMAWPQPLLLIVLRRTTQSVNEFDTKYARMAMCTYTDTLCFG